jgi:hypothetical protein
MSGNWSPAAEPREDRAISFTIDAKVDDLRRFLRDRTADIEGTIDVEGLAAGRPLRGTLLMDPVLGRKLVYDFRFDDDAGVEHRFVGRKDVDPRRLMETMTTLPAEIFDGRGDRVGNGKLRFDVRSDLVAFLRSFKPYF